MRIALYGGIALFLGMVAVVLTVLSREERAQAPPVADAPPAYAGTRLRSEAVQQIGSFSDEARRAAYPQITADQLYSEYSTNEASADLKYKGEILFIRGVIRAIKKDSNQVPYLDMQTSSNFNSVEARFRKISASTLDGLHSGDRVVVRCVGAGSMLDVPIIQDCLLIEQRK